MPEKYKRAVDNGKCLRALLTDLPRAFDCLSHEMFIVKLHAYYFNLTALKLVKRYLSNINKIQK